MNIGSLLDALATAVAPPSSNANTPSSVDGVSNFSELLGQEQACLANPAVSSSSAMPALGQASGTTKTIPALNELLVKLGSALEKLDDVALVAFAQLIFSLESKGPIGIRVESAGVKSAALPAEAEQFWGQLLQFLSQNGLPQLPNADGSIPVLDSGAKTNLRQWMANWLKDTAKPDVAEGKSAQNEASLASPASSGGEALNVATGVSLAKNDAALTATSSSVVPQQVSAEPKAKEIGEAKVPLKLDATQSAKSSSEELTSELARSPIENPAEAQELPETQKSDVLPKAKGASAVIVISEKADRMRSVVLQVLQQRLASEKLAVAPSAASELEGETWQKLKAWLKGAAATSTDNQAAAQNSSSKALEFLQFVHQRRQGVWETALSQDDSADSTEPTAPKANMKTSVATRDHNLDPSLMTTTIQKALPMVKAYGVGALNLPMVIESLPPVLSDATRKESETTNAPSTQRDAVEMTTTLARDSGELRSVSATPHSSPQIHRADDAIFQKFLDHTKAQLKMWVDRKLVAMQVQMEPVDLGRMQMKTVLEHGRIGVLFQVENAAAKALLLQDSQALKDVLEAQGLEVAGFYVEVWQGDRQQSQNFSSKTSAGPEFDMAKLLDGEGASSEVSAPTKRGLIDSVA